MKTAVLLVVAAILSSGTAWATCGAAYFNNDITWWHNSPLYFSVAGAPANTCGDLYAQRNADAGFDFEAGDWICTDGSGNATKGPWLWQYQGDDETASAYIDWGSCNSPVASHIWDKGWPTASVTSSCPSAFSGTATDDTWAPASTATGRSAKASSRTRRRASGTTRDRGRTTPTTSRPSPAPAAACRR